MTAKGQKLGIGSRLAAFTAVFGIIVAVNVIMSNISLRKDLTEEKVYELSAGTREVLRNLDEPVTLKFFFNSGNPEVPSHLKAYARRVEDLLREYELAADGGIVIEKYDPEPDSVAEDWARKYGVASQSMGFMGPAIYMGIAAVKGRQEDALPALSPQTEDLLEYHVTRMITRVTDPEKPVVGMLTGLPVTGAAGPMSSRGQDSGWFIAEDLRQDYDVRELDTETREIGDEIDVLVLIHPQDLPEKTVYAIDQFVLSGGRILAFVDPHSVAEMESAGPQNRQARFGPKSSNLPRLFPAWGVKFNPGEVTADLEASTRLRGPDNSVEDSPVWLSLREQHMNSDEIVTSHLESLMMPYAGSFSVEDSENVKVTPLVASSETSCKMDTMTAQFGGAGVRRNFKSGLTRLNLAVRLHGTFTTAFPEGRPAAEDAGEEEDESPEPAREHLSESVQPATVVLAADADMLYDRFCVREIRNPFGYQLHEPMNDNLNFFANAVETLAGDPALVEIRTKGRMERPFEVVLELQKEAQERYLEEEERLQNKLREAQSRLQELETRKEENQRFVLSAEQQAAIERFQDEVIQTKKQLKLVRRQLRKDIEKLGVKVKVLNILLMPCVVALGGLLFWLHRRRKAGSPRVPREAGGRE
ncbi:MAG: Gldg family protein [Kiritimatiellia bacterium]